MAMNILNFFKNIFCIKVGKKKIIFVVNGYKLRFKKYLSELCYFFFYIQTKKSKIEVLIIEVSNATILVFFIYSN